MMHVYCISNETTRIVIPCTPFMVDVRPLTFNTGLFHNILLMSHSKKKTTSSVKKYLCTTDHTDLSENSLIKLRLAVT